MVSEISCLIEKNFMKDENFLGLFKANSKERTIISCSYLIDSCFTGNFFINNQIEISLKINVIKYIIKSIHSNQVFII